MVGVCAVFFLKWLRWGVDPDAKKMGSLISQSHLTKRYDQAYWPRQEAHLKVSGVTAHLLTQFCKNSLANTHRNPLHRQNITFTSFFIDLSAAITLFTRSRKQTTKKIWKKTQNNQTNLFQVYSYNKNLSVNFVNVFNTTALGTSKLKW